MEPSEVDHPKDVEDGSVRGSKNAAVRKLFHELGIPKEQLLPLERFKFLTRLHYWAADTKTHGPKSPWGENEIDYILFITIPSKDCLTLQPHADEVDAVRWVSKSELKAMIEDPSLLFSPWFRIIANRWLLPDKSGWWHDLNVTMTTNMHCDFANIHRFDPPDEHLGGAGNAGRLYKNIGGTGDSQNVGTL
jgi:isopentenyl-diphosphate delta-isomerase